jgi:hypothetical protein
MGSAALEDPSEVPCREKFKFCKAGVQRQIASCFEPLFRYIALDSVEYPMDRVIYLLAEHRDLILLALAGLYLAWCVVNVLVAQNRGRDTKAAFFGSLFLTPFLWYLYLVGSPARQPQNPSKPSP